MHCNYVIQSFLDILHIIAQVTLGWMATLIISPVLQPAIDYPSKTS